MGFSVASVFLSYFLIAGGTFLSGLLGGRPGVASGYLGYIIPAAGGLVGGLIAARASRGSTIIEPAIGAVLLIVSLVAVGAKASGADAGQILLLPTTMKAIGLTAAASGGGGIAGAFLGEKLFGEDPPLYISWILFVAVAAFGGGVLGTIFGGVLGHGTSAAMLGALAACSFVVGISAGASATTRPLGAAFLGGAIGVGAFFYLALVVLLAVFTTTTSGAAQADTGLTSEVYTGLAILAGGAGIATLIGAVIGWTAVGRKYAD